ncbi:MAG: nickel pincer cofactor biosynthesis protein LarB [Thermoplasmata archaeon]|nr:nickel pincer cofactor biosynthesis protein LarB [Thermoplasmata archaeon]
MRASGKRGTGTSGSGEIVVDDYARIDHDRLRRTGVPEVILGEGKSVEQLVGILRSVRARGLGALVSRPSAAQRRALRGAANSDLRTRSLAGGRILRIPGLLGGSYRNGTVAILAAGTSDVAVAREAEAVLVELGIRVACAFDVGVAGLHRLLRALRRLEPRKPEMYLVFAGREGALPTVVAGLVRAPVVGIPTSIGYGRGGRGHAALNAMLQSCAPIAVFNIDAAVPAALFAAQRFATEPSGTRRARRNSTAHQRGRP